MTSEQQPLLQAAERLGARLHDLYEALPEDERQVMDLVMRLMVEDAEHRGYVRLPGFTAEMTLYSPANYTTLLPAIVNGARQGEAPQTE